LHLSLPMPWSLHCMTACLRRMDRYLHHHPWSPALSIKSEHGYHMPQSLT
jgi:hypothetical protein